jgi:hypothetical protein
MDESIIVSKVLRFKDSTGTRGVPVFMNPLPLMREVISEALTDRKKEQDRIYIVCGDVGKGKSLWCLLNSEVHDSLARVNTPIENITRNLSEFEERLSVTPKGSFLTIDEGSELSSDRHGEKQVKIIREKFTVMRKKAHLIFICFTNPLRINSYFREDRFRGIFICKKIGTIYYYSAQRYFDILPNIQKDMGNSKATRMFLRYAPNYILYNVPEYKGLLREEYESRKDSNIDAKLLMSKRPSDSKSLRSSAEFLGVSVKIINKYIALGDVFPIIIGRRKYLTLNDVHKLDSILSKGSKYSKDSIFNATDPHIQGEKND